MSKKATFGAWLRKSRHEKKKSLRSLAEQSGITFSYLSKIETGHLPPPSDESLENLADALGVDRVDAYLEAGKVPPALAVAFEQGLVSKGLYRRLSWLIAPMALKVIERDTYPIGAHWAKLEIPSRERQEWLEDTLGRLGLAWYGDYHLTLLAGRTARDIARVGSLCGKTWGTVVVSDWGWTLYQVGAGEIAHGEWVI